MYLFNKKIYMRCTLVSAFILFISLCSRSAGAEDRIAIPKYKDKYTDMVTRLEHGDTTINFKTLRFAFLQSQQYSVRKSSSYEFDSLNALLLRSAAQKDHQVTIAAAKALLGIDYTYLYAHRHLSKALKNTGDSSYARYRAIEVGLLGSIISEYQGHVNWSEPQMVQLESIQMLGFNGLNCETAWEVAQVYEEYFVLDMLGAEVIEQSVINCSGRQCYKMKIKNWQGNYGVHYYFDVSRMWKENEKRSRY